MHHPRHKPDPRFPRLPALLAPQILTFAAPAGLYFCFKKLTDGTTFLITFALTAIYFSGGAPQAPGSPAERKKERSTSALLFELPEPGSPAAPMRRVWRALPDPCNL
jgi:hypothetical protein